MLNSRQLTSNQWEIHDTGGRIGIVNEIEGRYYFHADFPNSALSILTNGKPYASLEGMLVVFNEHIQDFCCIEEEEF